MRSIWAAALLLCAIAGPATAGSIHGTLHVPVTGTQPLPNGNAYPGQAHSMPGMHSVVHGLMTDAVVYIDPVPAAVESAYAAARAAPPRLAQKDQMFMPRVVAIAAGASVDFPNQDPIYHNVFSLSPTRRFDLGKYPKGSSRRIDFKKPGIVNVYCEIHSNMEAFIAVLPNHVFTRPTANGEFAFSGLPPGSYQLHVWHPDLGTQDATIDVSSTGEGVASVEY